MNTKRIAEIEAADKYNEGYTVLTSTYVYQHGKKLGHEKEIYIPFPHVSSISFEYTAPISLVFLAIIALSIGVLGYYLEDVAGYELEEIWGLLYRPVWIMLGGITVFVILIALFFLGRKQSLNITSASNSIRLRIEGNNKQVLKKFASDVQLQQIAFIKSMSQTKDTRAVDSDEKVVDSDELQYPRFSADDI